MVNVPPNDTLSPPDNSSVRPERHMDGDSRCTINCYLELIYPCCNFCLYRYHFWLDIFAKINISAPELSAVFLWYAQLVIHFMITPTCLSCLRPNVKSLIKFAQTCICWKILLAIFHFLMSGVWKTNMLYYWSAGDFNLVWLMRASLEILITANNISDCVKTNKNIWTY